MLQLLYKQCYVVQDGSVLQCLSKCCCKQGKTRYMFGLDCIDAQGAT